MAFIESHKTPQAGLYSSLQLLRFIAAFMVLVTHATFFVSSRGFTEFGIWKAGAQGVSLFFVLSGFVMLISAQGLIGKPDAFKRFIKARLIRIVPLYWALNLAKLCFILAIPGVAFASPNISNVVLSMLFIPSRNTQGVIEAFYGVGWTLNFEMFFYLLMAIALLWKWHIMPWVTSVLLVCVAFSFIRTDDWPAMTSYFDTIVLNFLWGIWIAQLTLRGYRLPPLIAAFCVIAGFGIILFAPGFMILELQFAAVVAGLVALEPTLKPYIHRWLIYGGDASYSLYLTHPMIGVIVALGLSQSGFGAWAIFGTVILACLIGSALSYSLFEKPITQWLRKRFVPAPTSPS